MHNSRRARLVLGVLLIAAIALITLDFRDGGMSPARNVGADIFGPVERVTHDVTDPVASLFDSITGGPSAKALYVGWGWRATSGSAAGSPPTP